MKNNKTITSLLIILILTIIISFIRPAAADTTQIKDENTRLLIETNSNNLIKDNQRYGVILPTMPTFVGSPSYSGIFEFFSDTAILTFWHEISDENLRLFVKVSPTSSEFFFCPGGSQFSVIQNGLEFGDAFRATDGNNNSICDDITLARIFLVDQWSFRPNFDESKAFTLSYADKSLYYSGSLDVGSYTGNTDPTIVLRMQPEIFPQKLLRTSQVETENLSRAYKSQKAKVINLDFLSEKELLKIQTKNNPRHTKATLIGIPRLLPQLKTSQFLWDDAISGGKVTTLQIVSDEAKALRMGIVVNKLPSGTEFRFYSPSSPDKNYLLTADQILSLIQKNIAVDGLNDNSKTYWSPIIEGNAIELEIYVKDNNDIADLDIDLVSVSHLFNDVRLTSDDLRSLSGSCNLDYKCYDDSWEVGKSVAKIIFSKAGGTYLCSGVLINNEAKKPYFLTANHCISTQTVASSLSSYWFYSSSFCNSSYAGNYSELSSGGTLLYSNSINDVTMLELNEDPPVGAWLSGWDAGIINLYENITGIHHPLGDLKKISFGYVKDIVPSEFNDTNDNTHIEVIWQHGITEGGSSGSGLFLEGGYLTGTLTSGYSNCSNPYGPDQYGRFNLAYFDGLKNWLVSIINGSCGSSDGNTFASVPTTNLCTAGTASQVEGTGPWSWDCSGSNGGTTANCTANLISNIVCSSTTLTIEDKAYSVDITEQSQVNIITNGTISVKNGVIVLYEAPTITLNSGFHAEKGSQFTAKSMSISCDSNTLTKTSLLETRVLTVDSEEQPTDIQTAQTSEYLISQWLTAVDIPKSLQRLLADKNAIANEIQSDASGDIIVFSSQTALLDNDTNDVSDIYAYHSATDSLSLISYTIDNTSGNGSSTQARINGTGNYIIYRSEADNLNCSSKENHTDDNNASDIYLYDIAGRQTIRVSWEEDGSQTQHNASNPSIAGNEPYMAYDKGDNFQQQHVYCVDTTVDSLSGIKYSTDYNNFGELIDNSQPGISADGRYVAYLGQSKDENKTCTQHILDRVTGNSQIILCPGEIAGNPEQWFPLFDSKAENVFWQQIK